MVQAIPEGFHSLTPSFTFKNSKLAIEFYKKAFTAKLMDLFPSPDGKGVMHATLKIGDSIIMMGDEMNGSENCKSAETLGSSPMSLFFYVTDVDATFAQAVDAGGTSVMPVADMFWGDRMGQIKDPFGYSWMIATHKQDMTNEEMEQKAKEFFASMGQ